MALPKAHTPYASLSALICCWQEALQSSVLYAKTIFIKEGGALKRLSHVTSHCCLLSQELAGCLPAKLRGSQHQLPCQPQPCRELGRASLFTSLHSSRTRFSTNAAGSHRREGELEHSHLGKKVNAPLCEEKRSSQCQENRERTLHYSLPTRVSTPLRSYYPLVWTQRDLQMSLTYADFVNWCD